MLHFAYCYYNIYYILLYFNFNLYVGKQRTTSLVFPLFCPSALYFFCGFDGSEAEVLL